MHSSHCQVHTPGHTHLLLLLHPRGHHFGTPPHPLCGLLIAPRSEQARDAQNKTANKHGLKGHQSTIGQRQKR